MQNNFGKTFSISTRVAMSSCPVTVVEATTNDFKHNKRMIRTNSPLPGTGFLGVVGDALEDTAGMQYRLYAQGGPVDLSAYYKDSERKVNRMRVVAPKALMQRKNPIRNMSQVPFGDAFYYAGKHMFSTTSAETFGNGGEPHAIEGADSVSRLGSTAPSRVGSAAPSRLLSSAHSRQGRAESSASSVPSSPSKPGTGSVRLLSSRRSDSRTNASTHHCGIEGSIAYRYKSTQALVGSARLDTLHRDISDRVTSKVVSGNKDMIRMFYFYATTVKGVGVIGHVEFEAIARKLGTYITLREAEALFGRYDTACTGMLSYFQFIKNFMDVSDQVVFDED